VEAVELHFTYVPADCKELQQGDVLRRTPEMESLLAEVHPHFHRKAANVYFMVLTQSCDLVRRDGKPCDAPHITIAPVRALDEVISRQLSLTRLPAVNAELPVLTHTARNKLADFVRRLLNNNEPRYFHLEAAGTGLPHDCCAFLSLSIAIKADLHYDTCLKAKVLQLEDAFQAKLGSLIGQMYSRVGTQDWDPAMLEAKVKALTENAAIYIPHDKAKPIEKACAALQPGIDGNLISKSQIQQVLHNIPKKKKQAMGSVETTLRDVLGQDHPKIEKILGRLNADPTLNALLKEAD
jgi:hypothetical protein